MVYVLDKLKQIFLIHIGFKVCIIYIILLEIFHIDFIEWLDDIGLPQYKEYFAESKVDGRLLNNLTLVRRILKKKKTKIY